jgi:hypothetical protein
MGSSEPEKGNVMVKSLDEMQKLGQENAEASTMPVDVFSKRAGDRDRGRRLFEEILRRERQGI